MLTLSKDAIVAQLESSEEFPVWLSDVWEWLGYARKDSAVRAFMSLEMAESVDYILSHTNEENPKGGRPEVEIKMTIDAFKLWAMSARTEKGKEVRLYYLQIEKEWKAAKLNAMPQIRPEHIEAHQFKVAQYAPWALTNPVAAKVFTGWLVDEHRQSCQQPTQPVFSIPSGEIQEALNGAFLNLNRSGLAMNKLFHWIDRMPTMDRMGREAMTELADSLQEAETQIAKLKADRTKLKTEASDLKTALKASESQVKTLSRELEQLKAKYKDAPIPATVARSGSRGFDAKSANPRILPPSDR